jgi:hypothetical protein
VDLIQGVDFSICQWRVFEIAQDWKPPSGQNLGDHENLQLVGCCFHKFNSLISIEILSHKWFFFFFISYGNFYLHLI